MKHPEMVGRSEEFSILRDKLQNAENGTGSTVFISGEAGLGKTRLATELIEDANKRGRKGHQGVVSVRESPAVDARTRSSQQVRIISSCGRTTAA